MVLVNWLVSTVIVALAVLAIYAVAGLLVFGEVIDFSRGFVAFFVVVAGIISLFGLEDFQNESRADRRQRELTEYDPLRYRNMQSVCFGLRWISYDTSSDDACRYVRTFESEFSKTNANQAKDPKSEPSGDILTSDDV